MSTWLRRGRRAFTLIELIVALVVVAILAALAIPTYRQVVDGAYDASAGTSLLAVAREAAALRTLEAGTGWDAGNPIKAMGETNYSAAGAGDVAGITAAGSQHFTPSAGSDQVIPGQEGTYTGSDAYGTVGLAITADAQTLGLTMRSRSGRCVYAQTGPTGSGHWYVSKAKYTSCGAGPSVDPAYAMSSNGTKVDLAAGTSGSAGTSGASGTVASISSVALAPTTTPGTFRVSWVPGAGSATTYTATAQAVSGTATPATATCTWTSGPYQCTLSGLTDASGYTVSVVASDGSTTGTPAGAPGTTASASVVAVPAAYSSTTLYPAGGSGAKAVGQAVDSARNHYIATLSFVDGLTRIYKYDPAGTQQWVARIPQNMDQSFSMALDSAGDLLVSARASCDGNTTPPCTKTFTSGDGTTVDQTITATSSSYIARVTPQGAWANITVLDAQTAGFEGAAVAADPTGGAWVNIGYRMCSGKGSGWVKVAGVTHYLPAVPGGTCGTTSEADNDSVLVVRVDATGTPQFGRLAYLTQNSARSALAGGGAIPDGTGGAIFIGEESTTAAGTAPYVANFTGATGSVAFTSSSSAPDVLLHVHLDAAGNWGWVSSANFNGGFQPFAEWMNSDGLNVMTYAPTDTAFGGGTSGVNFGGGSQVYTGPNGDIVYTMDPATGTVTGIQNLGVDTGAARPAGGQAQLGDGTPVFALSTDHAFGPMPAPPASEYAFAHLTGHQGTFAVNWAIPVTTSSGAAVESTCHCSAAGGGVLWLNVNVLKNTTAPQYARFGQVEVETPGNNNNAFAMARFTDEGVSG